MRRLQHRCMRAPAKTAETLRPHIRKLAQRCVSRPGPVGRQQGFVLITVILLLALVSVIAFLNNQGTTMNAEEVDRANDADQALQLARAGLAHATWEAQEGNCSGNVTVPAQPLNGGTYKATASAAATSTTYAIQVEQDTWVDENSPGTNFGGDTALHVKNESGKNRRTLFRFNLSAITTGSRVVSAAAWFYVASRDDKGAVNLHEVNQDWTEGTGTWATIGAGYDATPAAAIPVQSRDNVWVRVNLTALVQGWVSGSVVNRGIMLIATSDSSESKYNSRESGNAGQRPWLEVVVGTGAATTRLKATGTSSGGAVGTLTRAAVPLYQPPTTTVLQPDAAHGQDGWITSTQTGWNYGSDASLSVDSSTQRSLLRFELGALPTGVRVESATLALYATSPNPTGTVDLHRVTHSWTEGSCLGTGGCTADGATWATYDGSSNWSTAGGDFDATPEDSQAIPASADWMQWDVTALVNDWLSGNRPDYGVLLTATGGSAAFASSDYGDAAYHPRLAITIRCQCGEVCQAPQGQGNLLLIVQNAGSLSGTETTIRETLNAWGYLVTPLSYNVAQSAFDAAVANNDVIYVPAETSQSVVDSPLGLVLGDRMRTVTKGVVLAQGGFNDEIGTASATASPVGKAINVTDTSHYITRIFAPGSLPIKTAATTLMTAAGTTAPGLQTLADIGGAAGLAVLDKGASLYGGGTAAARRVMLPIGSKQSSNWNQLDNDGRLLVQRALHWASGNSAGASLTPMKIYWTDDQANKIQRSDGDGSNVEDVLTGLNAPIGLDIDTVNGKIYWTNRLQIERANLDGSDIEILHTDTVNTFDIKLDVDHGKMYWTHDDGSKVVTGANLDGSGAQTISMSPNRAAFISLDTTTGRIYLTESASGRISRMNMDGSGLTKLVTHLDTPMGNGLDLNAGKVYWTDGAAGDKLNRANLDGSGAATIVSGLNAAQDAAVDTVNGKVYWVDALTVPAVKRANLDGSNVETLVTGLTRPRGIVVVSAAALGAGGGGSGGGSGGGGGGSGGGSGCGGGYRDEFKNPVFSGNDGSLTWTGDWQEINESDGPTSGDVQVSADLYESPPMPTYQMYVRNHSGSSGKGLMRALDLTGAATAVLSFDYKPSGLDKGSDWVSVQMSSTGTAGPWTEIVRFAGPASETAYQPFSTDISAHVSANAVLRFISSSTLGSSDYVFFDNVDITCTP